MNHLFTIINGFRTDNEHRTVIFFGEDYPILDGQIQEPVYFERVFLNEEQQPINILRTKNPGPKVFERDLIRFDRRLASPAQPVLKKNPGGTLLSGRLELSDKIA